jgi:hypothetical protein
MSIKYKTGICGCGDVGIVVEMTERLWVEFFSVVGYGKPDTVAGCDMCRTDGEAFAAPITPVMQATT